MNSRSYLALTAHLNLQSFAAELYRVTSEETRESYLILADSVTGAEREFRARLLLDGVPIQVVERLTLRTEVSS